MSRNEWDAAAYHRVSGPQFAWGLRVLGRVALAGDERVLDAGCGSGRLSAELAARVPHGRVAGADLSENMARSARRVLPAVVVADLVTLPFAGAFDLVFSTATFHWVRDHARLFTSLHGVLRAGGRLEAQCGGAGNLARVHARATALAAEPPFREHFAAWTEPWEFASPETTERRLRDAGFVDGRCWLEEAPTPFAGADAYREFMSQVVMRPYFARLPTPALRARFLDAITEAASGDEPPFVLDYWRLNISAVAC